MQDCNVAHSRNMQLFLNREDEGKFVLNPAHCPPRQIMQHALFEQDDQEIRNAADKRQQNDGDEHHRRVALAFAEGQKIAQPRIAADQFSDHDTNDGQRRADAKARE